MFKRIKNIESMLCTVRGLYNLNKFNIFKD